MNFVPVHQYNHFFFVKSFLLSFFFYYYLSIAAVNICNLRQFSQVGFDLFIDGIDVFRLFFLIYQFIV